jgi:hypothetical protein
MCTTTIPWASRIEALVIPFVRSWKLQQSFPLGLLRVEVHDAALAHARESGAERRMHGVGDRRTACEQRRRDDGQGDGQARAHASSLQDEQVWCEDRGGRLPAG